MNEELVLTPGGYRPKSRVHLIESGHIARVTDDRIQTVDSSGKVLAELESIKSESHMKRVSKVTEKTNAVPAPGTGWIVDAVWRRPPGTKICYFTTTWLVPPAPSTQSGQLIYLFNGMQSGPGVDPPWILQPVLQWGISGAGGGNFWGVASWFATQSPGHSFNSPLTAVNPGDALLGIMELFSFDGGANYQYMSSFQINGNPVPDSVLTANPSFELTDSFQTLEAYNLTACTDYPNSDFTSMAGIVIDVYPGAPSADPQSQGSPAVLTWTAENRVTNCGQSTEVVGADLVNLHYHT